jgi:hypothetical protein
MKRPRDERPDPRDVLHEIGQVGNDLVQFIRADTSGELPAGSPVEINLPPAMIPLPPDSAIAQLHRLRQDILDRSHTLCDLLAEAFTIGNRGQLAAAIEPEAGEPRGEIAAELCQIVRDLGQARGGRFLGLGSRDFHRGVESLATDQSVGLRDCFSLRGRNLSSWNHA